MYKNILIPVLVGEGHDAQASFSVAKALADDGARFTVFHVLEDIPNYVAAEIPNDVLASKRTQAEQSLSELATAISGAETKMVTGHAGGSIVQYADAHNIDCIVLASHRPGLADFFLGSTASRVVRHAKCAVHIIR